MVPIELHGYGNLIGDLVRPAIAGRVDGTS